MLIFKILFTTPEPDDFRGDFNGLVFIFLKNIHLYLSKNNE